MEGPARERRARWVLLALLLLLALGLAAASPAHKGLHDVDPHGAHGGDDCVACALTIVEGPATGLVLGAPLEASPAPPAAPCQLPRAVAPEPHAPRGPPAPGA